MNYGDQIVPVKVGDEIDVTIEAEGKKGDGIAKKDGFVLFVPGAKQGQNLRIKITRVLKSVGFAETLGDAEGPVDAGQPQAPVAQPEPAEPAPEDSEDFGEEPEEEPAAEESAPAEQTLAEPAEEATEQASSEEAAPAEESTEPAAEETKENQ